MLYFLLIIIAIGVLLISQEGKKLLGILWKLAFLASGILLIFGIGAMAIAFFTSDTGKSFAYEALSIFIIIGLCIGIYYDWNYPVESTKDKEKRSGIWKKIKNSYIKKSVKRLWNSCLERWSESRNSKVAIICIILGLSFLAIPFIFALFLTD